jgi:catechol 2,3-dioxygenase-like lactoylglutathione lyase family enzyme
VRSVEDALTSLGAAGSAPARRAPLSDSRAAVRDVDGVTVELVQDSSVLLPELRYVRILCADLPRSTAWYGLIGLVTVGTPTATTWKDEDGSSTTTTEQVMRFGSQPAVDVVLTADPNSPQGQLAHSAANHRGIFRLAFAVRDVARAVETARADLGIDCRDPERMLLPGSPLGGVTVSTLRDPNGVMLELVERDI